MQRTTASWSPTPSRCRASSRTAIRMAVGERGVAVVVHPGRRRAAAVAGKAASVRWRPAPAVRRPGRRRTRRAGRAAERRRAHHADVRRGLRRRPRRGDGARRALKAPIVHALRGKEHVEYDNPFDVGMTGLIGFASGYARDEGLRHAADAGHRLPLPAVLSGATRRSCRSTSGRRASADALPARPRRRRRRRRDARRAAAAAATQGGPNASSTRRWRTTRRRAPISTSSPRASRAARRSTRSISPGC